MIDELKRRALNIFISVDQLVYVLITAGHGSPDETLSSAAWRLEQRGQWAGRAFRPVLDFIARPFDGPGHCSRAYEAEMLRRHLPGAFGVQEGLD